MQLRYTVPILLVAVFLHAPGPAVARTLTVPDPYPTIQTAIDSAAAGDSVLVSPGTYVENLHTDGKELTLKSLGSPENTIIDGNQQGSVIWVTADAHIEGFTIQNGRADDGGGILVGSTETDLLIVRISGNIIAQNSAPLFDQGRGGGIMLYRATDSQIIDNQFYQNYAGYSGGGIYKEIGSGNILTGNVFLENGCHACGGGVLGSFQEVVGNLFLENWSDTQAGGFCGRALVFRNNTIVGNYTKNPAFSVGAGILVNDTNVSHNIVALNHGPRGGIGIYCGSVGTVSRLECNDVWGNDIDYYLPAGCDTTGGFNISLDPLFCDPENGNYSLQAGSPCSEAANPTCGQIGAFGVACPGTSVERATWGRLKQMFGEKN